MYLITRIGPECETSGKRKACKNCSCGLAEELEKEVKAVVNPPSSSCGNVCIRLIHLCCLFIYYISYLYLYLYL